MTLNDAVEKAGRAICANHGLDPDEKLEWGPYVGGSALRVNKPKERWRCLDDKLNLREQMIALCAVGVLSLTD